MALTYAGCLLLVFGTANCRAMASDACRGDHCSLAESFTDTEDSFLQMSKMATRSNKAATAHQPELPADIAGISLVQPLSCRAHRGPIQVVQDRESYTDGYQVVELDIEKAQLKELWKIPFTKTDPPSADLNACGLNPVDNKIYCVMFAEASYIIRMDEDVIEFVSELPEWTYNTGGFGPTGTFYVATARGQIIVVENLAAHPGYTDLAKAKGDRKLMDLRESGRKLPSGWVRSSDLVVVRHDFGDGSGQGEYVISPFGSNLQIARYDFERKKFAASWTLKLDWGKSDAGDKDFGAAWNFQGKLYFENTNAAEGEHSGVFELPISKIDLKSKKDIKMTKVMDAPRAINTDGFNCMNLASPFVTRVLPFDCSAKPDAVQLVKVEYPGVNFTNFRLPAKEYIVATADFSTGNHKTLYTISANLTEPAFVSLNGAGINPVDSIAYGALKMEWWKNELTPSPFYIVRFDEGKIEFVAKVQGDNDAIAGTFDSKGTFMVSAHPHLYTFPDIDTWVGYPTATSKGLPSFTQKDGMLLKDVEPIADVVVVQGAFDGGEPASYIMGFNQHQQMMLANLETRKSWVIKTNKVLSYGGGNFGAGWNFNGTIFFSSNDGEGVFRVPLDQIDTKTLKDIELEKVGKSRTVHDNDGMNCMGAAAPN